MTVPVVSLQILQQQERDTTHVITLLPSPSSTKTEADKRGPCASLKQQNREDDTEAEAQAGADDHGGKTAIPLQRNTVSDRCPA